MKDNNPCPQERPKNELGIWFLSYTNRTQALYKGIAVIKAHDSAEAMKIFMNNSMHNGTGTKLKVNKLYEIGVSYEPELLAEEYVKIMES